MFRSGFVSLVGRPSVGKSTLLNQLIGQKVAITSSVPQTTRHRIKGIVNSDKGQLILMDTPGFSKPLDQLGTYLVDEGMAALSQADLIALVVDGACPPGKGDQWLAQKIQDSGKPCLLILNKTDLMKAHPERLATYYQQYIHLFKSETLFRAIRVSAKTGKNMALLPDILIRKLPEGPAYYDPETVTDQRIREIAAEIIREKVLLNTREELPHSIAVGIELFDESDPEITRLSATLYVDQDSQKGMIIGKNGAMIRTIGTAARPEIEDMLDKKVYLALDVKTRKNWRKDARFLKSLGLALPENAMR
jgi:GTPase